MQMKEYVFPMTSEARMPGFTRVLVLSLFWLGSASVQAAELDLHKSVIVSPDNLSKQEKKALTLVVEEVQKRTLIRWEIRSTWPAEPVPVIAIGPASNLAQFAGPYSGQLTGPPTPTGAEGYRIVIAKSGKNSPAVFVIGNDSR